MSEVFRRDVIEGEKVDLARKKISKAANRQIRSRKNSKDSDSNQNTENLETNISN